MLWIGLIAFLSYGFILAGIVSDVQVAGGYLYETWTDHTTIYDLTVDPPVVVSTIEYPESLSYPDQDQYFAINAVVEKNRLYIYYYYANFDNGIRIYDLTTLESPELLDILFLYSHYYGNIQGGMLANREMLPNPSYPYGQFLAHDDTVLFTGGYWGGSSPVSFFFLYDSVSKERKMISTGTGNPYPCSAYSNFAGYSPVFFVDFSDRLLIYTYYQFYETLLNGYLDNYQVCFTKYFPEGDNPYYDGQIAGPMVKNKGLIIARWFGYMYSLLGSGLAIMDFSEIDHFEVKVVSDFYCTYLATHGTDSDDMGEDFWNSLTDVQDILVHNDEIYLSSFHTRSIAHTYQNKDWGTDLACADYWGFYDIPETGRPYGIAAANGTLYVAGKDKRYNFPLAKPDAELPVGGITSMEFSENEISISGSAYDPEGVRDVFLRLDNQYSFLAKNSSYYDRSHSRPMELTEEERLTCEWTVKIDTNKVNAGNYTMKVIAEDMDGDFSVIHEEVVEIPSIIKKRADMGQNDE